MEYVNFGDVSAQHGQFWIAFGDDDWATCVEITAGCEVGLADNQYRIEKGSIYFSPGHWDAALSVVGFDKIGPPEYLEIAYAFNAYMGFDRDTWGVEIVQIGKVMDDWTVFGTTCDDPNVVLHGNCSIDKYLRENWLEV